MSVQPQPDHISIRLEDIEQYQKSFDAQRGNQIAMNAVVHNDVKKVALNKEALSEMYLTFSTEIKSGKITAQKQSGRCWIFAAMNFLRLKVMEKLNIESLELSQSYLMFYDKLERCNLFLENILETIEEEVDSRVVMWLLFKPMEDGGQWDMIVNLIKKYGVVPQDVYPESVSSSCTREMNTQIQRKLREYASILREAYRQGEKLSELRRRKAEMLETIYRILTIHNGVPPKTFNWSCQDKDGTFHRADKNITPQQFLEKYVDVTVEDYVSLVHCPTREYGKTYTVKHIGNIVEGQRICYLNVPLETLKQAALDTLKSEETVWFGSDVAAFLERSRGVIDPQSMRFDLLYDTQFNMDKATRIAYRDSIPSHAMLLTGVHEEDGRIVRWKVENSWGQESGQEGFLVMSDSWFDEYVFQILVPKKHVSPDVLKALEVDPVILEPWDPLGTLA